MNRYGRILKRIRFDKNELIKRKGYYDMIIYDRNNKIIAKTKIDNDVLNRIKNINGVVPRKEKFLCQNRYKKFKKREALYLPSLILGKNRVIK